MDLICFSHLRWNFVYQRPHHILSRFTKNYRVFYIEEPLYTAQEDGYDLFSTDENIIVVTLHLKDNNQENAITRQQHILNTFFKDIHIDNYLFWYYNPMALRISGHLKPLAIVYDCMDELAAFKFAPPELVETENKLFEQADLVFTGGFSLYEAKKHKHHNIHAFPSSIDKDHFIKAREHLSEPADQVNIPHPRLGFFGVIDERLDIKLITQLAQQKTDWQFIILGPVVKIDPATLPKFDNIHYLGAKSYGELPYYIQQWDVALIPFAINESTRFISPTKTPEYLAAGKPVISSPIKDVINFYGENGLVHIAQTADEFIAAAEEELNRTDRAKWLAYIDTFLDLNSWDDTYAQMNELLNDLLSNQKKAPIKIKNYV